MASFGAEDDSEVEVDDSRPLDVCTVDEAVEKIGFGVFQVIAMSFAGLIWVSVFGTGRADGRVYLYCTRTFILYIISILNLVNRQITSHLLKPVTS